MGRISAREVAETTKNAVKLFTWQIKYEPGRSQERIRDALVLVGKPVFIQKFPTTVAEAVVVYGGRVYREIAIITLFSKDKWDAEVGREIALNKALTEIARHIFKNERKRRLSNGNGK